MTGTLVVYFGYILQVICNVIYTLWYVCAHFTVWHLLTDWHFCYVYIVTVVFAIYDWLILLYHFMALLTQWAQGNLISSWRPLQDCQRGIEAVLGRSSTFSALLGLIVCHHWVTLILHIMTEWLCYLHFMTECHFIFTLWLNDMLVYNVYIYLHFMSKWHFYLHWWVSDTFIYTLWLNDTFVKFTSYDWAKLVCLLWPCWRDCTCYSI